MEFHNLSLDFLNKLQTVSCDDFLPRTHAHSHTGFSAARTSHARVRFAQNSFRTRTRTFMAKG